MKTPGSDKASVGWFEDKEMEEEYDTVPRKLVPRKLMAREQNTNPTPGQNDTVVRKTDDNNLSDNSCNNYLHISLKEHTKCNLPHLFSVTS